jgi:SHS2 domain-containing protein
MRYRVVDEISMADTAFEAEGATLGELFQAAGEATLSVMVSDIQTVSLKDTRHIRLSSDHPRELLHDFLQKIIYFKDVDELLLRPTRIFVSEEAHAFSLDGILQGEKLDQKKHDLIVDVKAVTYHRFRVEKTPQGWIATVVLDI